MSTPDILASILSSFNTRAASRMRLSASLVSHAPSSSSLAAFFLFGTWFQNRHCLVNIPAVVVLPGGGSDADHKCLLVGSSFSSCSVATAVKVL